MVSLYSSSTLFGSYLYPYCNKAVQFTYSLVNVMQLMLYEPLDEPSALFVSAANNVAAWHLAVLPEITVLCPNVTVNTVLMNNTAQYM